MVTARTPRVDANAGRRRHHRLRRVRASISGGARIGKPSARRWRSFRGWPRPRRGQGRASFPCRRSERSLLGVTRDSGHQLVLGGARPRRRVHQIEGLDDRGGLEPGTPGPEARCRRGLEGEHVGSGTNPAQSPATLPVPGHERGGTCSTRIRPVAVAPGSSPGAGDLVSASIGVT